MIFSGQWLSILSLVCYLFIRLWVLKMIFSVCCFYPLFAWLFQRLLALQCRLTTFTVLKLFFHSVECPCNKLCIIKTSTFILKSLNESLVILGIFNFSASDRMSSLDSFKVFIHSFIGRIFSCWCKGRGQRMSQAGYTTGLSGYHSWNSLEWEMLVVSRFKIFCKYRGTFCWHWESFFNKREPCQGDLIMVGYSQPRVKAFSLYPCLRSHMWLRSWKAKGLLSALIWRSHEDDVCVEIKNTKMWNG